MSEKKSRCCNCTYFERYYTKEVKHYQSMKCGYCRKKRENVSSVDGCADFVSKPKPRRSLRLLKLYLSDILTEISEVRQLLENENGEADDEENM